MRTVEKYFLVSMAWFIATLAIIPVGGFHESNPQHQTYIWAFVVSAVNCLLAIVLLYIIDKRELKDE